MSQPSDMSGLARQLEANEIAAWRAIYSGPPAALATQLGFGYAEQGHTLMIWNRSARTQLFNRVIGLGVFEPAGTALIDALLARARAEHVRVLVHVAPAATPATLGALLAERGLVPVQPWLTHYRSLGPALPAVQAPDGYRIERTALADAPTWSTTLLAAWGFASQATIGVATMPLVQDTRTICFAAIHTASGEVAGAAALYITGNVAGLYGDGVRPQHRKRGLQDALIAARLAEARRQGCALVCGQTLADHPAQHNLARAGFAVAYTRANYIVPA